MVSWDPGSPICLQGWMEGRLHPSILLPSKGLQGGMLLPGSYTIPVGAGFSGFAPDVLCPFL